MSTILLCYNSTVATPINGQASTVDGDRLGYYAFDTTVTGLSTLVANKTCTLPCGFLRPLAAGESPNGLTMTPSTALNTKVAAALAAGLQS